jgi:hypothetical protein
MMMNQPLKRHPGAGLDVAQRRQWLVGGTAEARRMVE